MENVVIFGTGGHAKVVYDILLKQQLYTPVAFLSLNNSMTNFLGLPHYHQSLLAQKNFISGVVAIGDNFIRNQVVEYIMDNVHGFKFISAIHPSVQIAEGVKIAHGTVAMANTVINSGSSIGSHTILNTGSIIDHDCIINQFASIAPGCVLGGNVEVGDFSAISLGANIIHGKKIGSHTVIGAGSLVLNDIDSLMLAYGNPCKVIRTRTQGEKYL